jgi:hypothetical protein
MVPPLRCPSVASATFRARELCRPGQSRFFSSTRQQNQRITRARAQMFRWLNTQGAYYLDPVPDSPNYLNLRRKAGEARKKADDEDAALPTNFRGQTKIPFPGNPFFISEPVLNEETRENIWTRVMQDGQSVREVSASLGIEMRRVGAVVRLMEVEKEWLRIVSRLY